MTRNSFIIAATVLNLAFSTSAFAQHARPVKFLFGGGPFTYSGGGSSCDSGCDCGAPPKCGCDSKPRCGCDAPPKCGCDAPPSCGCDSGCGQSKCTAICIRQIKIPNPFPELVHDLHCGYDSMVRNACDASKRSFSIPVLDLTSCGGGGGGCDSGCDCGAPPKCGCDAKPGCGCGTNFCDCHGGGGKGYAPPHPTINGQSPFQDDIPTPPTPPTAYRGNKAPVRLPHSYLHRSAGFQY